MLTVRNSLQPRSHAEKPVSAKAGTYEIEAHPIRAESNSSRAITVEGSPVEVQGCWLRASVDCSHDQPLALHNPTDETVHILYRRYRSRRPPYEPEMVIWKRGWSVIESGEVERWGTRDDGESYYWAYPPDDRGGEPLPINGKPSPLHIPIVPCEEIEIMRSSE